VVIDYRCPKAATHWRWVAGVLALLLLGQHDGQRVWKSFDWDAMDRLHKKGLISDPVGRAKSVILTNEGLERAERKKS
jgi:hypothetical protein